jgi:hypothetical protein
VARTITFLPLVGRDDAFRALALRLAGRFTLGRLAVAELARFFVARRTLARVAAFRLAML